MLYDIIKLRVENGEHFCPGIVMAKDVSEEDAKIIVHLLNNSELNTLFQFGAIGHE